MLNDDENTWSCSVGITFLCAFQEPNKLLQPVDKTLKTMAIEFAEYQVSIRLILYPLDNHYILNGEVYVDQDSCWLLSLLCIRFSNYLSSWNVPGLRGFIYHYPVIYRYCFYLSHPQNNWRAGILSNLAISTFVILFWFVFLIIF